MLSWIPPPFARQATIFLVKTKSFLLLCLLIGSLLPGLMPAAAEPAATTYYLPFVVRPANVVVPFGNVISGNATYYWEADGRGNCLYDALPEPQYVGAMNWEDYNDPHINGQPYPAATLCGAFVRVTGRKGTITVQIVDQCPDAGCVRGHIDLSPEAFAAIDDMPLGFVPITWQLLSPPLADPLRFRYKDGSSQWWTAVQIQNHRNPIARVELKRGGSWQTLPRTTWNYFLADGGFGVGYHTFRITDVFGNQLVETSKIYLDGYRPNTVDWTGTGQFPPPP